MTTMMTHQHHSILALLAIAVMAGSLLFAATKRHQSTSFLLRNSNIIEESQYARNLLSVGLSQFSDPKSVTSTDGGLLRPNNKLLVCGQPTNIDSATDGLTLKSKYTTCPKMDKNKNTVILKGHQLFGRTGNHLRALFNAFQYTRDNDFQLGIARDSWAMDVLTSMFMVHGGDMEGWESHIEEALCVKIFRSEPDLSGWKTPQINRKNRLVYGHLFYYQSTTPLEEQVSSYSYTLRTMFSSYNTGDGFDRFGNQVQDMCSGIHSLFGGEDRIPAIYSVVHQRSLEGGPGLDILAAEANRTGCDPTAALSMEPEYIKSILAPLDMLGHPIVLITDGQNMEVVERLMADPSIGPMIRTVPEESCWFGGDVMLGVMANVFIGNPASTMSVFVGKSRVALGLGHTYVYLARNENGDWVTVCGDDCLFGQTEQLDLSKHYGKANLVQY
mmetsp:Transcript_19010/g.41193  ORF Transcript_19010/g.41193 Transcript_19010/m.41193 type:complete len:443 (-) Transcript_19010:325-1653(-)|eukprot:CAMPEP_0172313912 /NCGR_PEP_ID=MMETSP1058-20130122/21246_1 /TAXON_ID=83371 /ORGANISM="Detonula confervacea, Strain CCMP 353" /LENGTH=442 /DNA_ID=CAMNT_0013027649 /DNA_START=59 /DNA_END=1387 /DNA_ORIENTATION=-